MVGEDEVRVQDEATGLVELLIFVLQGSLGIPQQEQLGAGQVDLNNHQGTVVEILGYYSLTLKSKICNNTLSMLITSNLE